MAEQGTRPPQVTEKRYFKAYKSQVDPAVESSWTGFITREGGTEISLAFNASAVYSSNIEGNPIDLNSYMRSKLRGEVPSSTTREQREIDDLVEAYAFAESHSLTQENLLAAHGILSREILPEGVQGKYRSGQVFVYSRQGIIYAALEAEFLAAEMTLFFEGVTDLLGQNLSVDQVFYHASLIHLVFVHIHPFDDGNGRTARLLEKWFLASHLGPEAWKIPSEEFYWKNRLRTTTRSDWAPISTCWIMSPDNPPRSSNTRTRAAFPFLGSCPSR